MLAAANGSECGWFALVCYVPDPLGSALGVLARDLSSTHRPKAHITLLPPRPLRRPLEEISDFVWSRLEQFPAFDVGLSEVCRFDGTNVLYLALAEGNETIHHLHDALDRGDLAYDEPFEFRPHLTLSEPLSEAEIDAVQRRAEALWKSFAVSRFRVEEIAFLYMAPGEEQAQWERQWSVALRKALPTQSGR